MEAFAGLMFGWQYAHNIEITLYGSSQVLPKAKEVEDWSFAASKKRAGSSCLRQKQIADTSFSMPDTSARRRPLF